MSTEEIREGILRCIHIHNGNNTYIEDDDALCDEIFHYLHSKGVVIKVHAVMAGQHMTDVYLVEPLVEQRTDPADIILKSLSDKD